MIGPEVLVHRNAEHVAGLEPETEIQLRWNRHDLAPQALVIFARIEEIRNAGGARRVEQ
jgi:hypothetical protein